MATSQQAIECLLVGVGSPYVYEVHESLRRDGWVVRAFIDNQNQGVGPADLGEVLKFEAAPDGWLGLPVLIPLLTPGIRKLIRAQLEGAGFSYFPEHCDPKAVVADSARLGAGTLVNAGAKVRIGANAIVGAGAVVIDDVEASVVVGNPAKVIKRGIIGYGDVSV